MGKDFLPEELAKQAWQSLHSGLFAKPPMVLLRPPPTALPRVDHAKATAPDSFTQVPLPLNRVRFLVAVVARVYIFPLQYCGVAQLSKTRRVIRKSVSGFLQYGDGLSDFQSEGGEVPC